jgi:hypothetical protein
MFILLNDSTIRETSAISLTENTIKFISEGDSYEVVTNNIISITDVNPI